MAGRHPITEDTDRRWKHAHEVLQELRRLHFGAIGRFGEIGVTLKLVNGQVSEVIEIQQISHK